MSFPMVVAISTEALLLILVIAATLNGMSSEIKKHRLEDPTFKPGGSDLVAFIILMLWMGFQAWKAWSVIRTLL